MNIYNKYYINLDRCKERKLFMENLYDNITRIEGYDGKKLHEYNDIILSNNYVENPGQIGCSLSHIKAIIHSYKNGDKGALILEDDISNEYLSKWDKSIEEIILNSPEDCECIQLFCNNIKRVKEMIKMKNDYYRWKKGGWGNGCYYINEKGMKKIYDLYYKEGKIDLTINIDNYYADDSILYTQVITYHYTKPLFINKLFESTIMKLDCHLIIYNYITNYFKNKNNNDNKNINFTMIK